MATIINNPGDSSDRNAGGTGLIVGILLAVLMVALFFLYLLPAMRNQTTQPSGTNINVELPSNPITTPTAPSNPATPTTDPQPKQ